MRIDSYDMVESGWHRLPSATTRCLTGGHTYPLKGLPENYLELEEFAFERWSR